MAALEKTSARRSKELSLVPAQRGMVIGVGNPIADQRAPAQKKTPQDDGHKAFRKLETQPGACKMLLPRGLAEGKEPAGVMVSERFCPNSG